MTFKALAFSTVLGLALCAGPSWAQSVTTFQPPSEDLSRLQTRVYDLERLLRDATDEAERAQIEVRRLKSENERLQKLLDDALRQQGVGLSDPASGDAAVAEGAPPTPPQRETVAETKPPAATGVLGTLPAEAATGDAGEAFRAAQRLLHQSRFAEAEVALGAFLNYYPTSEDAPEARYWLGRTQIVRGRHADAAASFVQLLRESPKTPRAADAWVRLGIALRGMGQTEQACATFKDLGVRYPGAAQTIVQLAQQQAREAGCAR